MWRILPAWYGLPEAARWLSSANFSGSTAPDGWLLSFGQAVSRATYAALFALFGTTYGAGDGSTTFNLPDLRGRVAAGQDDMGGTSANRLTDQSGGVDGDVLGDTGGAETHVLTAAESPAHVHQNLRGAALNGASSVRGTFGDGTGANTVGATEASGGGGAHNNVPPTILLSYIIKT